MCGVGLVMLACCSLGVICLRMYYAPSEAAEEYGDKPAPRAPPSRGATRRDLHAAPPEPPWRSIAPTKSDVAAASAPSARWGSEEARPARRSASSGRPPPAASGAKKSAPSPEASKRRTPPPVSLHPPNAAAAAKADDPLAAQGENAGGSTSASEVPRVSIGTGKGSARPPKKATAGGASTAPRRMPKSASAGVALGLKASTAPTPEGITTAPEKRSKRQTRKAPKAAASSDDITDKARNAADDEAMLKMLRDARAAALARHLKQTPSTEE